IRESEFDLGLLLPNSFESALMMFLGRVPKRIGYRTDARDWMLTNSIAPIKDSRHQVEYYLDLVSVLTTTHTRPSIEIQATHNERVTARRLLGAEGISNGARFLVLNPGAAYGSAKRWHEDRFAAVAETLSTELGMHVALIGSEGERFIAEQIR